MNRWRLREGQTEPEGREGRDLELRREEMSCSLLKCHHPPWLHVFWCMCLTLGPHSREDPKPLHFKRGWGCWRFWKAYGCGGLSAETTPAEAGLRSGCSRTWHNVLCHPPDMTVAKLCDPASKYLLNSVLPWPHHAPGSPGPVGSYTANACTFLTLVAPLLSSKKLKALCVAFKVHINLVPAHFSRIIRPPAHLLSVQLCCGMDDSSFGVAMLS